MSDSNDAEVRGAFPEIVVHHLNNSRSQRILWLLEELGVPYELVRYERDRKTMMAPKALRDLHPLGKSPVITVDGEVVAETGLIVQYLCARFDGKKLAPPSASADMTPKRMRWLYWIHYAEGSAMPVLLLKLVFSRMPLQAPKLLKWLVKSISRQGQVDFVDPQLKLHLDYLEGELRKNEWFAGPEFSAADIMMSFPIEGARRIYQFAGSRPKLQEFLDRIHSRPAYIRALQRGGPYDYA
jgi:glutathione S-transferase